MDPLVPMIADVLCFATIVYLLLSWNIFFDESRFNIVPLSDMPIP